MSPSGMEPPNPSLPGSPDSEIARLGAAIADLQRRVAVLERGALPVVVRPAAMGTTQSDRFGLKLVNRIGAITLALGIIFFFKYAVDNEWIGAFGRVLLGLIIGVVLLAAADWLRRRDQQVFAQGLAGCGLATLYISVYAASAYYKLISQQVAFLLLLVLCSFTLFLSIRFASAASAALAFGGALLTPVLLRFLEPGSWAFFELAYLVVIFLAALAIASRQTWPILISIVAGLSTISALVRINPQHALLFVLFMSALALSHFLFPQRLSSDTRIRAHAYVVAHSAVLIALLRIVGLWAEQNVVAADRASFLSEAGSVLIAIYGITTLVFGLARRSTLDRTFALTLIGLVVCKLYVYDVWLLNRFYRVSAFVALGILLLTASYVYSRSKRIENG